MLLPFLVGKNLRFLGRRFSPILLASGVSGDFGGPAEARSKDDLEEKAPAPAPVVLVCVFLFYACFFWGFLGRNGRTGMKMDMAMFGCIFMGE